MQNNNNKQFLINMMQTNRDNIQKKLKQYTQIKQNQDTKQIQTNTKQQKPHTKLIKNTKNGNKIKKQ